MKLSYYPETDSLYIDLAERSSVESREISEGVVLDYDAEGKLVGIDIDNASYKVELKMLVLSKFAGEGGDGGSVKRKRKLPLLVCAIINTMIKNNALWNSNMLDLRHGCSAPFSLYAG